MSNKRFATKLVHGGFTPDGQTGAVNVPIYQTSTYRQKKLGEPTGGWEYSRTGNPTRAALEKLIAELEGGEAGFAFASGMAAISAVLMLFNAGDKILVSSNVYGGTFRVLDKVFTRFGLKYELVDSTKLNNIEEKIDSSVKAIYIETPTNPLLEITDLRGVAEISKKHGILSIVDNTFMTPYLQRPIELGIDIVVHSATKYLGGHSDLIAGLAIVANGTGLADRLAFIQNSTGGVLQPFDSFLLIRGIRTLGVRMDRHVSNTEKIVSYLINEPAVNRVYYPGHPSDPGYSLNLTQASKGGAMLSFELAPGYSPEKFLENLNLIMLAESLGGVESLVCHPASMTHASIPADIRKKIGISDGLLRLSVGIEDADDLIDDIKQALEASGR
ncbi:MAG: aminotransferase class I/II-fold pyridoxal phosphate-dependent enzyme [Ruminobacter sp.]|uniref:trans-sulfuration enzyme family protein n=1 Tax=Ruminobacter sp. TaxID=2774296 RepID=UPI00257AC71F|nr:PLP-dependent aspartate aminotransferase family protein [Ruminobacter sp.]MBQ3775731.1 aminotransferase class I/II-fold pyridoxal phosphate-dependent enzyme [Ruminobacter sp.]